MKEEMGTAPGYKLFISAVKPILPLGWFMRNPVVNLLASLLEAMTNILKVMV